MKAQQARQVIERLTDQGVKVSGLCVDSRTLRSGDVFLAYPGERADGRRFIPSAVASGAAAVLWERQGFTWPPGIRVPNLPADDLRALAGHLAHLVYGRPSEKLWMAGVTGTNGKTSVTLWLAQCLERAGRRCALIGTLGCGFHEALDESPNTTPEAVSLHSDLARLLAVGARACAMEVSSIGLDQGRVNGVAFDVAVLTNLTRDHLEYHGTMEAYAEAKARLFAMSGLHSAVLNLDDPFGRLLADRLSGSGVRRVGYRIGPDNEHPSRVEASFVARDVAIEPAGLRFRLTSPEGQADVEAALVGRFNVSNLLAVLATLGEAGIPLDAAADLVRGLSPPPGRMQRLGGDDRPLAVIDYAHSPDALDQTLAALREVACARSGELICVFGCGGERDPGKRIEMGQVAAKRADRVVVTSDNPRREDPFVIIEQIRAGAPQARSIPDRAAAIGAAIGAANAADVVLIAGKGHERYQEVGGERRPFSDARQAARELDAWRKGRR